MPKRTDVRTGECIYVFPESVEKFLFETNKDIFFPDFKSLFVTGTVDKIKPLHISVRAGDNIQDIRNERVFNQNTFDDFCFVYENGPKIAKRVQELVKTRERGADRLRIINALWQR